MRVEARGKGRLPLVPQDPWAGDVLREKRQVVTGGRRGARVVLLARESRIDVVKKVKDKERQLEEGEDVRQDGSVRQGIGGGGRIVVGVGVNDVVAANLARHLAAGGGASEVVLAASSWGEDWV